MQNAGVGMQKAKERWQCLEPDRMAYQAKNFSDYLYSRVISQPRAVKAMTNVYQSHLAGMNSPNRPIGILLFLGPSGTGKTHLVEMAAEALFEKSSAMIKVDCGEFQHSHEIAKLIGSPPGYIGHQETEPIFTKQRLECNYTLHNQLTFILFDEIEKASDSLWHLLLGILDKATLTLGDNRKVDFSSCIICMTSNTGTREMDEFFSASIGFAPVRVDRQTQISIDKKIYHTALAAARRKFVPEFLNRIDKIVVFRPLGEEALNQILNLELGYVRERLRQRFSQSVELTYTEGARQLLLNEGLDYRYGVRHIKRSIERFVLMPMANLVATGQLEGGDNLLVDIVPGQRSLQFSKLGRANF